MENSETIKCFLDLVQREMDYVTTQKEYNISNNNFHLLSLNGRYLLDIHDLLFKLNKTVSDLNLGIYFIDKYKDMKLFNGGDVNEIAYINYHLEVFYHKIHTILEVKKLMINKAFELGLSDEDCNWRNLLKSRDEIGVYVIDVMDKYNKSFETIIKDRHLNTHRAINLNHGSKELDACLFIFNRIGSDNKLKDAIHQSSLNTCIEEFANRKVEYLKQVNEIAGRYVDCFINMILDEVIKRANEKLSV